jgi:UDP-GlcNAc3NAcA epimerase
VKVVTVVGTRPQFVKSWPVSRALAGAHEEILIHTGQHYDPEMSEVFFQTLGLKAPDYHLAVGSGPHGSQTGRMLEGIEGVLLRAEPDVVLVYGDTNSTLAGALAAAKLRLPVAHVEAGLRSFNREMPEEVNRVLTDHVSALHFCPTEQAVRNLELEGIVAGVHLVGDVMKDALEWWVNQAPASEDLLATYGVEPGRYYLATVHRAENVGDPERLAAILAALQALDQPVVLPLHPRTRAALDRFPLAAGGAIRTVPPVGYLEMLQLERQARAILTDSGGVQKEAYLLGVPCITMRDETEWPETVATGWNVLVGADTRRIVAVASSFPRPSQRPALFGDGRASDRIALLLTQLVE